MTYARDDRDVLSEWWLDESALPDEFWALLRILPDGGAVVLDLDGNHRAFDSIEAARWFLRDDEYRPLADVDDAARYTPPIGATDEELVARMRRVRRQPP